MKEIIVTIDVDGTPTVETKGFSGTECLKETAALEAALGAVANVKHTSEMRVSQTAGKVTAR